MENEANLWSTTVMEFRREYPEIVKNWEMEIAMGINNPDLHFCHYALDDFINLKARLIDQGYIQDFIINAHISRNVWEKQFVAVGHTDAEAEELANAELLLYYGAYNENRPTNKAIVIAEILKRESNQ